MQHASFGREVIGFMETLVETTLAAPKGDISFYALVLAGAHCRTDRNVGIACASVWCWAIIVDKIMIFGKTKRQMNRFETVFWSGQSLEELYKRCTIA
jgi:biopolymer transport protein TolQ